MIATTIITPAQMYWITRLDTFSNIFLMFSIIFTIITIMLFVVLFGSIADGDEGCIASAIKLLAICCPMQLINICGVAFTPSTKEMCAIYAIPAIVNNEKVQGIGEDFYVLAKEWMQELRPTK